MATTGFWPIKGKLKDLLDYAENPDKTTNPKFLDSDLYSALQYAENDDKTDCQLFVSGINCSKHTAYSQMIAVKRKYGENGKNIAYHGYQSFTEGEVTPEEAHEIGVETARKMWGNSYQVIVTTHLNTDNLHNHFVVNSVSFKDGKKFRNKIGDHKELRKISDEICKARGKTVLENTSFYNGEKESYWIHSQGGKTHRDYLREDVEYCLTYSSNWKQFILQLKSLGYTVDTVRLSVKAPNWQRAVRLSNIGFTEAVINKHFQNNLKIPHFDLRVWNYHLPYKPKKFPLEEQLRKYAFSFDSGYKPKATMIDVLFLLLILIFKIVREVSNTMLLSPDLRAASKDIKQYVSDYHFLTDNKIHTAYDLTTNIEDLKVKITELEYKRSKADNKRRRAKTPEERERYKQERKEISKELEPLRKKLKQAEQILEKSPHVYELLENEHRLEKKALNRNLERSR